MKILNKISIINFLRINFLTLVLKFLINIIFRFYNSATSYIYREIDKRNYFINLKKNSKLRKIFKNRKLIII